MAPLPLESKAVDLGLPSGLKWAAANLGAESETDPGFYYMWGEIEGHDKNSGYEFTSENYTANGLDSISKNLSLAQDAANVRLGGSWRMPTKTEYEELYNNTNVTWTTINGVVGRKFANKTDASKYIFMPATGYIQGTSLNGWGYNGNSWTSTADSISYSYKFTFNSSVNEISNDPRYYGFCVRGVC